MKTLRISLIIFICSLLVSATALAQEPFIYPSQGQSPQQLEKDKLGCYSWAKEQTGFDPMKTPTATTAPPQQEAQKGGVVKGAARGALVGVAVGAIAGDAGQGAAIGAAGGGLFGGMRRRDQQKQQQQAEQQWAQEQTANYSNQRNAYNRAYGVCLEGRGYTVK